MGQVYLRSLFALGFQTLLIIICVAIYVILCRASHCKPILLLQ
jgi:hypothetical protein